MTGPFLALAASLSWGVGDFLAGLSSRRLQLRTVLVVSQAAGLVSLAVLVAVRGEGPPEAFRLDEVKGVAVVVQLAQGRKCARSWKILPSVGSDPAYPDVSPRDAQALREWEAMRKAAE